MTTWVERLGKVVSGDDTRVTREDMDMMEWCVRKCIAIHTVMNDGAYEEEVSRTEDIYDIAESVADNLDVGVPK